MKLSLFLAPALLTILPLLPLVSCKTTAQVEQEQKVQGISGQLMENQKLSAEMTSRVQELEQKLAGLNGKIEELQYHSLPGEKEDLQSSMKEMEERVGLMEKNLQLVRQEIEAQRNFIESVTQTLQGLGKSSPPKLEKKKSEAPLKGKKTSSNELEQMLADPKITGKARAEVLHNLGMAYFTKNDYSQAMVLFSKLYKEFPGSSYNKNGLLHLAKSLLRSGEREQAKSALHLVIEKFPGESSGKEAQKILAELK